MTSVAVFGKQALSRRENAITGGNVDYKQSDKNNVLAIAQLYDS